MLLITTARKGKANVMAQSWHCMMEFEPQLVGCLISGRNHSFDALVATKECVLNIPTAKLLDKVVDTRLMNRYNFFVLEVVKAWVDPKEKNPRTLHHRGRGHFMVAGKTLRTTSRIK